MMHSGMHMSSIAWFKLADFVQRKEKERAYMVFVLLAHSLGDRAYKTELEADLYAAFNDEKAVEYYKNAGSLYEESGRYIEALAVYQKSGSLAADRELMERAQGLIELITAQSKAPSVYYQKLKMLIAEQLQAVAV